jgi:hypothetical protein
VIFNEDHLLSRLYPNCQQQKLGDAPEVIDNPVGVVYKAVLPESAFFKPAYPEGGNIKGEVTAVANDDGLGVRFTIKLSNLPKIGAPLRKSKPAPNPDAHRPSISTNAPQPTTST